jgi:hypothetical protein
MNQLPKMEGDMRKKSVFIALAFGLLVAGAAWFGAPPHEALAVTCFKSGEAVSGMNKICYYDCLGSTAAITISSVQLCPLTINR